MEHLSGKKEQRSQRDKRRSDRLKGKREVEKPPADSKKGPKTERQKKWDEEKRREQVESGQYGLPGAGRGTRIPSKKNKERDRKVNKKDLRDAALKVAAQNPEFRKALLAEIKVDSERGPRLRSLIHAMTTSNTKFAADVGKTILEQMGGRRLAGMLGVKKFIGIPNGLAFQWPNKTRSKGNYVEIVLTPQDLYDMTFYNWSLSGGKKPVKKYKGLYAEDLNPTFEHQTGWKTRMAKVVTKDIGKVQDLVPKWDATLDTAIQAIMRLEGQDQKDTAQALHDLLKQQSTDDGQIAADMKRQYKLAQRKQSKVVTAFVDKKEMSKYFEHLYQASLLAERWAATGQISPSQIKVFSEGLDRFMSIARKEAANVEETIGGARKGDILWGDSGATMQLPVFYEVLADTPFGKLAPIRKLESRLVSGDKYNQAGAKVPMLGHYAEGPIRAKVQNIGTGKIYIKVRNLRLVLWDGKPKSYNSYD